MVSSPWPTASVLLSPIMGSLRWKITSLAEEDGSLRTINTPREKLLSERMDSATSPSAPRRMTGMGGILLRVKVFGLEKPGIRESDAMRIGYWCRTHWLLMFCTLAVDTLGIEVDAECTDVNFAFIGCWRFVYCLKMLCTLILILFTIVAVATCIGCWLMPPALIFDWFMCWVLCRSGSYRAVYNGIF